MSRTVPSGRTGTDARVSQLRAMYGAAGASPFGPGIEGGEVVVAQRTGLVVAARVNGSREAEGGQPARGWQPPQRRPGGPGFHRSLALRSRSLLPARGCA